MMEKLQNNKQHEYVVKKRWKKNNKIKLQFTVWVQDRYSNIVLGSAACFVQDIFQY